MPPRAPRTVVAPPRNNVYVGMLGLACTGMALGCGLLGLELSGYDPVPAFQAVSLPKVEARPVAGGTAVPAAPPSGTTAQADPAPPVGPPAVVPPSLPPAPPPAPVVAAAEPPKVESPKPAAAGPRPGFNLAAPPRQ